MISRRGPHWQSPHSRLQRRPSPEARTGRCETLPLACMSFPRQCLPEQAGILGLQMTSNVNGADPDGVSHAVQVHKFGGTCVAAAERISEVAQLVVDDPAEQKLVVVSAMGSHPSSPVKVTDLLLNMVAKASKQDQAFLIDLAALQVRVMGCFKLFCTPAMCMTSAPESSTHAYHSSRSAAKDMFLCRHCCTTRHAGMQASHGCADSSAPACCRRSMWKRRSSCWVRGASSTRLCRACSTTSPT